VRFPYLKRIQDPLTSQSYPLTTEMYFHKYIYFLTLHSIYVLPLYLILRFGVI
jgi:hypothetical protein